jgi:plasmid stability protein
MPSLMLRGLPADLVARIRAYAQAHHLAVPDAAARLLASALDHLDARQRGGVGRWAGTTPAQRRTMTAAARQARHPQP